MAGHRMDTIGHEGAGEVVEVAQPGRVQVGDRVVIMPQLPCGTCALCRAGDYTYCENTVDYEAVHGTNDGSGTFSQYIVKPSWLLLPIPDSVTYEQATMAIDGIGASYAGMQAIGVDCVRHRADHRLGTGGPGRRHQRAIPRRTRAGGGAGAVAGRARPRAGCRGGARSV